LISSVPATNEAGSASTPGRTPVAIRTKGRRQRASIRAKMLVLMQLSRIEAHYLGGCGAIDLVAPHLRRI